MKNRLHATKIDASKMLLIVVFVVFVFFPFIQMLLNIDIEDFLNVTRSPAFGKAVLNTLTVATTTTVISVSLALLLAFCLQRTNIRYSVVFSVLIVVPMLIPSISHGMGLIVLFGTNGFITKMLGIDGTIYGFWGMVIASVLYSYPSAFLMLNDVLKYEDASPYEAAIVLGIPKTRRTLAITLPYLKRPLISAVFAVFTLVSTDYGIPLMIGGKNTTIAVMMYQEVLGQLDFSRGSVVGLFLLIPAFVTFVYNTLFRERGKQSFVTRPFTIKENKKRDFGAYLVCVLFIIMICALIIAFMVMAFAVQYPNNLSFTFQNILRTMQLRGGIYLKNSIVISIFVALIGVVSAFLTAYLTTRVPSKMSSLLHLFSIASLAIPGVVLGLSYSMTFSGSFLYGTLAILILANLMHFFASPYLMMYNSLSKMNQNLESVGKTLGIRRYLIIRDVIIPQSKTTLLEMGSYFFVNSMITISAVSFLATVSIKPISLLINQFEAQMQMSCAAVVTLALLGVNITIKGIIYFINRRQRVRENMLRTGV